MRRNPPRKKTKSKTSRQRLSGPNKSECNDTELIPSAQQAQQKFVNDIQIRGEAGPLKGGKLAKGLTHIERKKGSSMELTRARFNLT